LGIFAGLTKIGWLVLLKMPIHPALALWQAVRYRLLVDQVSMVILISTVLSALTLPALIVGFGGG